MIVASTFTMRASRNFACRAASCKNTLLGAPFQRGSVFGKKMADVRLAQRAEHRVADRVHQHVRVRMAVQALRVRNFHAAQDELAARDQLMNVITDANVNHCAQYIGHPMPDQAICCPLISGRICNGAL